jgi:hypothetical protein
LLQEVGDFLVRLHECAGENRSKGLIALGVEGRGKAAVANTASTTCEC